MDPDGATLPRFAGGRSRRPTLGVAAVLVAVAVGTRCLHRVVVVGGSMAPSLLEGDRLVAVSRPWGPPVHPAVGDVVALADPRTPDRILVKRVASVDRSAGTVEVLGDAPDASTDSRDFGPVPTASLVGRVVHRYGPPARSGPVSRSTEYHRS